MEVSCDLDSDPALATRFVTMHVMVTNDTRCGGMCSSLAGGCRLFEHECVWNLERNPERVAGADPERAGGARPQEGAGCEQGAGAGADLVKDTTETIGRIINVYA